MRLPSRSGSRARVVDRVGVDHDQLDVGRLGGLGEPLGAGRLGPGVVAQVAEVAGDLAGPLGVAVDDQGPGRGLGREEPGEDGTTRLDPAKGLRGRA